MSKQTKVLWVVIAVIVIFFLVNVTITFVVSSSYKQINHFEDISVCEMFDELKTSQKPLTDKYIKDIDYTSCYAYELEYNGAKFDLYAYEFSTMEDVNEYYKRVHGRASDRNVDFNGNSGVFSSNLIVKYNKNLYRMKTKNAFDYVKAMRFLNSHFSVIIITEDGRTADRIGNGSLS